MFSFDPTLVILLNAFTYGNPLISLLAIFCAVYVPYILLVIMVAYVFLDTKNAYKRGHVAMVALLSGLVARYVVKYFIVLGYTFSRPYVGLKEITLLIPPIITEELKTFPSGHTLFFFALSTVLYIFDKKLGTFFFVASFLISISRVMVGVHYPSDILGGAVIGILVGVLFSKLLNRKLRIT
jgi:undecaprenyl-diphosphatase